MNKKLVSVDKRIRYYRSVQIIYKNGLWLGQQLFIPSEKRFLLNTASLFDTITFCYQK